MLSHRAFNRQRRNMTKFSIEPSRILIVDDDQKILDLLVELLEVEGYEVRAARDGVTALDLRAIWKA